MGVVEQQQQQQQQAGAPSQSPSSSSAGAAGPAPPPSTGGGVGAPPLSPSASPRQIKATLDRDGRGINATYRKAILKALESLHDYQSRSNIDMIRRHTQDLLFEQEAIDRHAHPWNDALFLQTLKSIVRKGEVDLFTKSTAELTPTYKRQRADSLLHRLEDKIHAAAVAAATTTGPLLVPTMPFGDCKHPHPDSKKAPPRKSEHDKWKIVPKKIYDHSTIVNPMDTH